MAELQGYASDTVETPQRSLRDIYGTKSDRLRGDGEDSLFLSLLRATPECKPSTTAESPASSAESQSVEVVVVVRREE